MSSTDDNSLELVHAAAKRGVPEAQLLYGQLLLEGVQIERSPAAALHWFERAARRGHPMAINMVGRCIDQGWGVARSPRLALKWFRKAAEMGLDWGMYNLATLLTLAEGGVPLDRGEALHWLRRAVELGHVKSMNLLGGFYEDGWEVQQSREQAREYYRMAAQGGDFRGQFNYARMLTEEGDILGALHWLRRVPETATPAFLNKTRSYLLASPVTALRQFALTLRETPEEIASAHIALSEPTAAGAKI